MVADRTPSDRPLGTRRLPLPGRGDLVLGERTLLMGILNVTPDSFSDGGEFLDPDQAVARGLLMVEEGADLLDVGGESTRPGAAPVTPDAEQRRILPVIERLARETATPISVDTRRGGTARLALQAGASLVNDVSGLADPRLRAAVAEAGAPVVIMHMRGTPEDMRARAAHTRYADVMGEVVLELEERVGWAREAGIADSRILLDPGIGFAKLAPESFEVIRRLPELTALGFPVVAGPSRKSFLQTIVDREPQERLHATLGALTACVAGGAHIVRVHDIRPAREAIRAFEASGGGAIH